MEERTNYPLCLNVDDLGEAFMLTIQAVAQISAERVGKYMQAALGSLAGQPGGGLGTQAAGSLEQSVDRADR